MNDRPVIQPDGVYADARGRIVTLPAFRTISSTVIESRPGAVRGNHYHAHESHLMYVVSGLMLYIEEAQSGALRHFEVGSGESVITPAGAPHCTVFLEDTVFVALSDADRGGIRYEDEVVRVAPLHERPEFADAVARTRNLITVRHPVAERR